jgi:LCP family protein required for cell wall assembly
MSNKPSRLRRFLRFIALRIIPGLLLLGILWSGYRVVSAVATHISEISLSNSRLAAYVQTATAIASTITTNTPTQTATLNATATFTSTSTLTATTIPSATNTVAPAFTFTPTFTLTFTSTPQVVSQLFVTNTPQGANDSASTATNPPLLFVTNTPQTQPTSDVTPTPTATATLTTTPTPTPTVTIELTSTPPPLPTLFVPEAPDPSRVDVTAVPTAVEFVPREFDLVNILLLGTDGEITNDGSLRTDTMIIVSINRNTNTVAMLSLPRDLFVYIPDLGMQRLNVAYGYGEAVGWTDGGFGLLRQTILYNLGINVHYYALINLSGFEQIIDSVGGVDLSVDCAIQDYRLIGAELPAGTFRATEDGLYTLPVGFYHMTGAEALWYARSRHNSSDFDRGRRQQQLLRAIWRAARDAGLLTQAPTLWGEAMEVVQTDLELDDVLGLLPIALNLEGGDIESFRFARLYHTTPWTPPDGANVQLPNPDPVRELMVDFYTPPTDSQVTVESATISVYNGTTNADWDRVAADRLNWEGFAAVASGTADNTAYTETTLIDFTGEEKGSSLEAVASLLNIRPENVLIQPDPNRTADFQVIIGSNYNSCSEGGVLVPEEGGDATATP